MSSTPKTILLVDGNEKTRQSLKEFIISLGHKVCEAITGKDAIDQAFNAHPDLIMTEMRLPEFYGDELTIRLKKNIATRNIPVIINTGWTTDCHVEERIDRALNAGAAEVLYRPFQLPILRGVLRSHLLA